VGKDGHIRRWVAKVECHWVIKAGSPVLLLEANRLVVASSVDVLLRVFAAVATMMRGRDGHEMVAKQERRFANG